MNNSDENLNPEKTRNIDNMIELSVGFQYPNDEPHKDESDIRALEMLHQLASYIIPSKHPRLTFACLCYAAGMDVGLILGCDNTEAALSKALGIPKQNFCTECKTVRKQYNLNHSTTVKHNATKESYQNNSKNLKS